jgi:hypothetical protein
MGFGIVWTLRVLHTSRWAVALPLLRRHCAYSTRVPLVPLVPLVLLAMSSAVL